MEGIRKLDAARLYTGCLLLLGGDLSERCVSPSVPSKLSNVRILQESNRIYNYATASGWKANQIYYNDIKTRDESAGRLVDIAMPVRFSGGIRETGALIDSAENRFSRFERKLDQMSSEATFDKRCSYGELAKIAMHLDRELIDRTRLYLNSRLWMLWTLESLEQADQIYGLMLREDRFSEMGDNAFAYVAHPPIIVSILACTAMIEEVGAKYINQLVSGKSIDPDDTRASDILRILPEKFKGHSEFNISDIRETIVSSRNDLSHYLRKRRFAVTADNFEDHVTQGMACIRLVGILADELLSDVLEDYQNRILKNIVSFQ